MLHEGRGELCTVTGAETVHAHGALRGRRPALERATEACEAVLRLFDAAEANPAAYNLICHELALLDAEPEAATRAGALAFRLKLLLAAGFLPELSSCAACGGSEHLGAFSAGAGGVVCPGCEAGSFPLGSEAHRFLLEALAQPLAARVDAAPPALRQAERAITETLEHHAHVRLRRVA
jgi:DNA repair protein RecO (recombination protein O)